MTTTPAERDLPEGWKLVPMEPTPEMMAAAWGHAPGDMDDMDDGYFGQAYKDMLAAAPDAPARAALASSPAAPAVPSPAPSLTDEDFDAMAVARYTVVPNPDKVFGYAVHVGNGRGACYRGHRTECEAVAARMRGAFLDGAYVARHPDKCLPGSALAAPVAQPEPSPWQPIETAPKSIDHGNGRVEGVYLLGFCPDPDAVNLDSAVCVIWWEPYMKKGKGCWYGEGSCPTNPTHWMPLPPAPSQPEPTAGSQP